MSVVLKGVSHGMEYGNNADTKVECEIHLPFKIQSIAQLGELQYKIQGVVNEYIEGIINARVSRFVKLVHEAGDLDYPDGLNMAKLHYLLLDTRHESISDLGPLGRDVDREVTYFWIDLINGNRLRVSHYTRTGEVTVTLYKNGCEQQTNHEGSRRSTQWLYENILYLVKVLSRKD